MSEAALHKAVAEYLGWVIHPPVFWTTFPAGGGGKVRGAQLKAMGLKAGVPDILIFVPTGYSERMTGHDADGRIEWGPYSPKASTVIGIELKQPGKYLEPHQKEIHAAMKAAGVHCYTAKSVADVNLILRVNGVTKTTATASAQGRAA